TSTVIRFDDNGSLITQDVSVYSGSSLGSLHAITCGRTFAVELKAGVHYWFQVDGQTGESGQVNLHVTQGVAIANDDRAHAKSISTLPFTQALDNHYASIQTGDPAGDSFCPTTSGTVWYRFTPGANMTLRAQTIGSSFDTVLTVLSGPS